MGFAVPGISYDVNDGTVVVFVPVVVRDDDAFGLGAGRRGRVAFFSSCSSRCSDSDSDFAMSSPFDVDGFTVVAAALRLAFAAPPGIFAAFFSTGMALRAVLPRVACFLGGMT